MSAGELAPALAVDVEDLAPQLGGAAAAKADAIAGFVRGVAAVASARELPLARFLGRGPAPAGWLERQERRHAERVIEAIAGEVLEPQVIAGAGGLSRELARETGRDVSEHDVLAFAIEVSQGARLEPTYARVRARMLDWLPGRRPRSAVDALRTLRQRCRGLVDHHERQLQVEDLADHARSFGISARDAAAALASLAGPALSFGEAMRGIAAAARGLGDVVERATASERHAYRIAAVSTYRPADVRVKLIERANERANTSPISWIAALELEADLMYEAAAAGEDLALQPDVVRP